LKKFAARLKMPTLSGRQKHAARGALRAPTNGAGSVPHHLSHFECPRESSHRSFILWALGAHQFAAFSIASGWSETVARAGVHPLKSTAFRGALLRQSPKTHPGDLPCGLHCAPGFFSIRRIETVKSKRTAQLFTKMQRKCNSLFTLPR
jgi:hypothetical protein